MYVYRNARTVVWSFANHPRTLGPWQQDITPIKVLCVNALIEDVVLSQEPIVRPLWEKESQYKRYNSIIIIRVHT